MIKVGVVLLVLVALVGCAGQAASGEMVVREAWARPGLSAGSSAVYFTLDNQTGADDTLLSAACDDAAVVEVHQTLIDENGTMQMQHQADGVPLPAGEQVTFAPGGLHVMMMNLKHDLKPGDTLTVRLQFAKAGEVTVEAPVNEP